MYMTLRRFNINYDNEILIILFSFVWNYVYDLKEEYALLIMKTNL